MINKDRAFFQYNSGDLVYIIIPLMSQLHTASRIGIIKYVGLGVIYKIIDPQNYLLMTLDGNIFKRIVWTWKIKTSNVKNKWKEC